MNKARRKTLSELRDRMTEIHDILEEVMNEEECCRDNMPESLQGSERYEAMDAACDAMYEAISQLEEAADNIESAME